MKKRIRPAILLTLVLIFLFPQSTGCTPKEVEQTNDSLRVAYFGTVDLVAGALYEFKEAYPNVEVTVDAETYEETDDVGESFYTRISAEMMSGNGPDVFVFECEKLNANKMMRSGAFVDLNELTDGDPEWDLTGYNQAVIEAGQVDGKQYIMPLTYDIPLLLSTQSLLDETGFDISSADNYITFMEECLEYRQAGKKPELLVRNPLHMRPYFYQLSTEIINYDTRAVKVNTPEIRKATELYQRAIISQYYQDGLGETSAGGVYGAISLRDKTSLFERSIIPLEYHIQNYRALKAIGETPVTIPLYNVEGKLAAQVNEAVAINASSPNQQNAYEFIKLMLENTDYVFQGYFPVSNKAAERYMEQFMGEENQLSLISGDTGEFETLAALTQEEVDEYLDIIKKVDTAYIPERNVRSVYMEEIGPYLSGETDDIDTCLQNSEDKLKIIVSE